MDVKATLVEKTSKSGNLYKCIEIQLTDSYVKRVFLESAELELLEIANKKEKEEKSVFDF